MTLRMVPLLALCLAAGAAWSAPADGFGVEEQSIQYASWLKRTKAFGLQNDFPLLIRYGRDGKCLARMDLENDFSADDLAASVHPEPDCILFRSDGPGTPPKESRTEVLHLYVLDVPFCSACTHAEQVLRKLIDDQPDQWSLVITRVLTPAPNPSDGADCLTCTGKETAD